MYMELGILTKESDVYSFGVVLFEVLCGRLCLENSNGRFQSLVRMWKQMYKEKKLAEIIFQDLVQEMDPRSLETFSDVAFQCVQELHKDRPTMSVVVEKLKTALEFQEIYEELKHPLNYEKLIKSAVPPLTYKSGEELKSLLSKGILVKEPYKEQWFALNKNKEHCVMVLGFGSISETGSPVFMVSEKTSRYSSKLCCQATKGVFKAHVTTGYLSPHITYTLNLVFKFPKERQAPIGPCYAPIRYKLEGGTKYSVSFLADVREDGWYMAELYQFESQRRNFDLKIWFSGIMDGVSDSLIIEGIEFQPVEKVGHEVLEDDKEDMQTISESDDAYWEKQLPNDYEDIIKWSKDDVKWTTKKELYYILCKGFIMSSGHEWFFLAKSGKICVMLPARAALLQKQWKLKYEPESRFKEVAFDSTCSFDIVCKTKSKILSPKTTYACYLVYRLPTNNNFERPFEVKNIVSKNVSFIYLLDAQTPVIGPKDDQKSHTRLNRPKLKGMPRRREDGWMEVQVCEFQPGTSIELKLVLLDLHDPFDKRQSKLKPEGLTVQGIEFRPA